MKALGPVFFFVSLLLVVGLACNFGAPASTQAPPTQPVQVDNPTSAPEPTVAAPTEAPATEPPAPADPPSQQAQEFYTEEFDSLLSNDWAILTVTDSPDADPDKVKVEANDGKLVWDFDSEWVYYYMFNNAFDYEDVRVDVRADNRGKNNNNISLICRYDPDIGWYEFNIANNGLYDIYYAEVTSSGKIGYNRIVNGGSNSIKQGKAVNEYAIVCKGTELTLYINGDEVNSVNERNFGLRSGQVGMSVSSFNVLPVLIEMDWFKVSEP